MEKIQTARARADEASGELVFRISLGGNADGVLARRIPPGKGIAGVVQSGATEDANVDLTGELVNLIVAQRLYQANAQTIRAQDQILQTLVNLR